MAQIGTGKYTDLPTDRNTEMTVYRSPGFAYLRSDANLPAIRRIAKMGRNGQSIRLSFPSFLSSSGTKDEHSKQFEARCTSGPNSWSNMFRAVVMKNLIFNFLRFGFAEPI